MINRRNSNLFSASFLAVLIIIVSFLIYKQVEKNSQTKEDSLVVSELISENVKEDKEDVFYSEDEVEDLQNKSEEKIPRKDELKHEIFINGNINPDWFNKNIEKINGSYFLNNNKFFNYEREMKNKKFYLIAASLKDFNKAVRLRDELNSTGFKSILLPTKIGFYRVTLQAYNVDQKQLAMQEYHEARKNTRFKKAWIYVNNN
jgi:uncharacterized membrane protein